MAKSEKPRDLSNLILTLERACLPKWRKDTFCIAFALLFSFTRYLLENWYFVCQTAEKCWSLEWMESAVNLNTIQAQWKKKAPKYVWINCRDSGCPHLHESKDIKYCVNEPDWLCKPYDHVTSQELQLGLAKWPMWPTLCCALKWQQFVDKMQGV